MRGKAVRFFCWLAIILASFFASSSPLAHAAAGLYAAQDVIGQLDRNGQPTLNQALTSDKGLQYTNDTTIDNVHHRLFVMDYQRVLVYNLSNTNQLQSSYADNVLGSSSFTSFPGGVTQSSMGAAQGVAYDAAHDRLFVADTFNHRVLVFDLTAGLTNGMNASYVLGQSDFTSNTEGTSQNKFSRPEKMYFDTSTNRLFVADSENKRVVVFDTSGGITNGMNASYVLGQPDFTSNTSSVSQSSFSSAQSIAFDAARHMLFIGGTYRTAVFDLSSGITNGMNASYVIGQADFTSTDFDINHPYGNVGLAYDATAHQLFLSDNYHNRILAYDVTTYTNNPAPIAVLGQPDFTTTSGGASQSKIYSPRGVMFDSVSHSLYVTEYNNSRVLIFNTTSLSNGMNASGVIGQTNDDGTPNYTGDRPYNRNPNATSFNYPQGTTIDTVHHRMFVADCGWNRITVFALDANNNPASRAASYVIGQPNFNTMDTSSPITAQSLNCPVSTAYDAAHDRLFTTDSNGRVLVFNLAGGITNNMSASYVLGQPDFTTASSGGSPDQNSLSSPTGLIYDPTNSYLYVIDNSVHRIMVFNLAGGITNGMNASYVIGQPDFTSQDCAITQSGVTQPHGLALDTDHHRLFVADAASCNGSHAARVLVYDTAAISTGMNASAVIGEPDFTTSHDPNNATRNTVGFPNDLAYDSQNQYLFVSDDWANRVMVFDVASVTNGEDAVGVLGQQDFTSSNYDCMTNATDLCDAEGFVDHFDTATRRLYLSDSYNARILIFGFAKLANTIPDGTINGNYSVALGSQTQGTTTYTVESGSLPAGINLNSSTGVLSGTPTASGDSTFAIKVSDNNGVAGTYTDKKTYTFHVASSGDSGTTPSGGGSSNDTSPSKTNTTNADQQIAISEPGAEQTSTTVQTAATDQATTEPDTSAPISLDSLGFTTGGATAEVHEGDKLAYSLTENGKAITYHIVVKKISTDSVELAYETHDGDVTLHTGEERKVTVGQGGRFTVNTRLNSIVKNSARITFKLASATTPLPQSTSRTPLQPAHQNEWWYWVGGVTLGLIAIATLVYRKIKKSRGL